MRLSDHDSSIGVQHCTRETQCGKPRGLRIFWKRLSGDFHLRPTERSLSGKPVLIACGAGVCNQHDFSRLKSNASQCNSSGDVGVLWKFLRGRAGVALKELHRLRQCREFYAALSRRAEPCTSGVWRM